MVSYATIALVISIIFPVSVLAAVLWLFYLKEREHDRKSVDTKKKFKDLRGQLKKLDHRTTRSKDDVISKQQFNRAAFELQSRLSTQVVNGGKGNWLHEQKVKQDKYEKQAQLAEAAKRSNDDGAYQAAMAQLYGDDKDAYDYAKVSTLYFFCRYFYWSQYVVESALLVGLENATELYSLIDIIYFQVTGQTPVQGCQIKEFNRDEHDVHANIFFIKIMTIQAIAAAMHNESGSCVSVNEFYDLLRPGPSPSQGAAAETFKSRKDTFQDIIRPLGLQIDELAKLKPTAEDPAQQAPVRRMVILQVLLCKLVDLLDAGQPWDAGPLFDADEEPRMFQRNFRLTPMLNKITAPQRAWLKEQIFFRDDPELQFPGFREDLLTATAAGREKALTGFPPGVFPPAVPRRRDTEWLQKHLSTQGRAARNTLLRRQKAPHIEAQNGKTVPEQQPGLVPKPPLLTVVAPSHEGPRNVRRNQVASNVGSLAVVGLQGVEQAAAHEAEVSTGASARGSQAATESMAAAAQAHVQLQGQGPGQGQGHVSVYSPEPFAAASISAAGAHAYSPGRSTEDGQPGMHSTDSVLRCVTQSLPHTAAHSRSSRESTSSRGAGIGHSQAVNLATIHGTLLPGQNRSSDGVSSTLQAQQAEAQAKAEAAQAAMLQPTAQAPPQQQQLPAWAPAPLQLSSNGLAAADEVQAPMQAGTSLGALGSLPPINDIAARPMQGTMQTHMAPQRLDLLASGGHMRALLPGQQPSGQASAPAQQQVTQVPAALTRGSADGLQGLPMRQPLAPGVSNLSANGIPAGALTAAGEAMGSSLRQGLPSGQSGPRPLAPPLGAQTGHLASLSSSYPAPQAVASFIPLPSPALRPVEIRHESSASLLAARTSGGTSQSPTPISLPPHPSSSSGKAGSGPMGQGGGLGVGRAAALVSSTSGKSGRGADSAHAEALVPVGSGGTQQALASSRSSSAGMSGSGTGSSIGARSQIGPLQPAVLDAEAGVPYPHHPAPLSPDD